MSIKNWPKTDRPREKLLDVGAGALTDAELIAIFLLNGHKGRTAIDLAHNLLRRFGNLKQILDSPAHVLLKEKGFGQAKYAMLLAALELARRYQYQSTVVKENMRDSECASAYLTARLQCLQYEVFACLFLDGQFKLLRFEELSQGTINEAQVYPREVVRRALIYNAAKIILAHNHPSGCALPSHEDKEITRKISAALALIGIPVIDHIIIGNPDYFSFADCGLL